MMTRKKGPKLIPQKYWPRCNKCGKKKWVHYAGPDPFGHAFYCTKCGIGWAQSI